MTLDARAVGTGGQGWLPFNGDVSGGSWSPAPCAAELAVEGL